MNEISTEVRSAFALEQERLGQLGDTPARLLRDGLDSPSRPPAILRLAGAVAGLLVVAAVAAIWLTLLTRNHEQVPVGPTPHPSVAPSTVPTAPTIAVPPPTPTAPVPTPLALSTTFNVPDTTPAILFADPSNRAQVDAITWDGRVVGRLGVAESPRGWGGNPSGTYYVSNDAFFDRRGAQVALAPVTGKSFGAAWSEDGRRFCYMTSEVDPPPAGGTPTTLNLGGVGLPTKAVAGVGRRHEQNGVGPAACSLAADRALVIQAGPIGDPQQVWAIQLSTGRVIWTRTNAHEGSIYVTSSVSPDGRFVALNSIPCCPTGGAPATATVIGPDGSVVATLGGRVEGFSWDGSMIVISANADQTGVTVFDRASQRPLWSAPAGLKTARVATDPTNGGHLAVGLSTTGAYAGADGYLPAYDLYVVDAAGRADLIRAQIR